jgi:hypothetical protein
MARISTIKQGDFLYRVTREKMGNTTMSRDCVKAYFVDHVFERLGRKYVVTTGGTHISECRLDGYRRSPPEWVYHGLEGVATSAKPVKPFAMSPPASIQLQSGSGRQLAKW